MTGTERCDHGVSLSERCPVCEGQQNPARQAELDGRGGDGGDCQSRLHGPAVVGCTCLAAREQAHQEAARVAAGGKPWL